MVALTQEYQGEESTFEPIPPGEYVMHIVGSSMEPTRDGQGRYLKLDMEIIEGQQAGRRLTERLNLENRNAQAVEIAQRTLRAIVFACQLSACRDSEQLHHRRMLVRVNVKERTDKPGTMSNEIGGYKQVGGSTAGSGGSAPQQQSGATSGSSSSGGSPPWKR
jgi:hypothetical protein